MKTLSILIPVYNEEDCLKLIYKEVLKVVTRIDYNYELLFINDGSTDGSLELIRDIIKNDKSVRCLDLARNYGKEIAMAAGIDHIQGDAVVILDADLQHPPELIFEMIKHLESGYDDVFAASSERKGETLLKRVGSKAFYHVLDYFSDVEVQMDAGDFRMLSEKGIKAFREFREKERYTKGIFSMLGLNKKKIFYTKKQRVAGTTKWNYFKLLGLAIDGITSFTIKPLRLASLSGIIISFGALIYMSYIIFKTVIYGDPVSGYPSLLSIILFIGGVQLIAIGIIGEYVGRIFNEVKSRPLYQLNQIL